LVSKIGGFAAPPMQDKNIIRKVCELTGESYVYSWGLGSSNYVFVETIIILIRGGLFPSSKIVGYLLRTPWTAKSAGKMICT
jgi:hypothetical protein